MAQLERGERERGKGNVCVERGERGYSNSRFRIACMVMPDLSEQGVWVLELTFTPLTSAVLF